MSFGTELHDIWKITLIRISASINYFIEAFQSANEYVQIIQIYAENFVINIRFEYYTIRKNMIRSSIKINNIFNPFYFNWVNIFKSYELIY